jgi:hypothetical protein
MKLKKIIGTAAVAFGMIVAGLGFATPAFASSVGSAEIYVGLYKWYYHGKVDNNNNTIVLTSINRGFHIDFYEYNTAGNMYQLYVNANETYTWYLPQPVSQFRICGPNIVGGDTCTKWQYLDQ